MGCLVNRCLALFGGRTRTCGLDRAFAGAGGRLVDFPILCLLGSSLKSVEEGGARVGRPGVTEPMPGAPHRGLRLPRCRHCRAGRRGGEPSRRRQPRKPPPPPPTAAGFVHLGRGPRTSGVGPISIDRRDRTTVAFSPSRFERALLEPFRLADQTRASGSGSRRRSLRASAQGCCKRRKKPLSRHFHSIG